VANLKKASYDDLAKYGKISWNKSNEPEFYLYSGQKINEQEFSKQVQTNIYKQVFFFDDSNNLKIIVLEPLDDDSLKFTKKANEKILDVGYMMPNFKSTDINGEIIELSKMKGKIVVLNFWFIKCPPCRKEIPELNRIVSDFSKENIEFISISTDSENNIKKFLNKYEFNYRHISGENILEDFKVKSYPTNIVLDKNGEIVYLEIGGREDIYDQVRLGIEKASR
jgi:peroxiredoxin